MRLYGIISVVLLASLTSCGNKGGQATEEVPADSVLTDSLRNDSLQAIVEDYPMPKAADELFDDFVYNFVVNRKLQMERTRFPLPCEKDGKTVQLTKEQWKPERFFMRQGYYTLLFDSEKHMEVVKDTSINHAVVEKISLSSTVCVVHGCLLRNVPFLSSRISMHRSLRSITSLLLTRLSRLAVWQRLFSLWAPILTTTST